MTVVDERTVAVVVGGGSGVGRGVALGLADAGAAVVVADIEADAAARVHDEITVRGGRAAAATVDGTDRASLAELADAAVSAFGAVHVLSTNVGVVFDAPLLDATEEQWGWALECNLSSVVRAVSAFVPVLETDGGRAHVVATASLAALTVTDPADTGGVHLGLYTATKHAVLGYVETLRHELAPRGIGVSVLCPGTVDSNLMATSHRNRPTRWGGPVEVPETAGAIPWAMPSEAVGPIVVAGIRDDRLHILTHPKAIAAVRRRHEALRADFDFFATLPGG